MNKILFGGAFDPIHNGHLNMAENAKKALDGEIILVPARISVWKENSAPVADKIAMIELAIEDKKSFSIEKYEIDNKQDITYHRNHYRNRPCNRTDSDNSDNL